MDKVHCLVITVYEHYRYVVHYRVLMRMMTIKFIAL